MDIICSTLANLDAAIIATPQILTIAGLSLDILGVVFLVLFPPPQLRWLREPGFLMLEGAESLAERHPWLRWVGPAAIVFGFVLQIVANVIEIS